DDLVTGVQTCALPICPTCRRGIDGRETEITSHPARRRIRFHRAGLGETLSGGGGGNAAAGPARADGGGRSVLGSGETVPRRDPRSEERRVGDGWRCGW